MLVEVPAAQLSHPPSRSGWLADDVILGASLTSLSVETKSSRVTPSKFSFQKRRWNVTQELFVHQIQDDFWDAEWHHSS